MNLQNLQEQLLAILPHVARIGGVVIGGLLLSWIAKRGIVWAVRRTGLDALAERLGVARLLYGLKVGRGIDYVLGQVAWYVGLLLTAAVTADMLGLDAVAQATGMIAAYLPRVVAAAAVMVGGLALADLVRRVVERFVRGREDVEQPQALASVAYYGVIVIAAVGAARQAGIETALIESLLTTLVSIAAAALALAFALGSRDSFHHFVAGHFLRRLLRPGDRVRFGDTDGVVVRYFGVCVVLETEAGETTVPCAVVLREQLHVERLGAKARAARTEDPASHEEA